MLNPIRLGRKGQQIEKLNHTIRARQEDEQSADNEDAQCENCERPVCIDRLPEGLGDRERHASDQILEVGNHEQDGTLVRIVRGIKGEFIRI